MRQRVSFLPASCGIQGTTDTTEKDQSRRLRDGYHGQGIPGHGQTHATSHNSATAGTGGEPSAWRCGFGGILPSLYEGSARVERSSPTTMQPEAIADAVRRLDDPLGRQRCVADGHQRAERFS